jgi:hypothetical protein
MYFLLMNTSTAKLGVVLSALTQAARKFTLNDSDWAARAGLRKETLSRLRHRSSCDFATLEALAAVVGCQLVVAPELRPETSLDGHFPLQANRDYEQRLLELCATRSLDPARWIALGPRFFMAGLAVMLASVTGFDRQGLLALAESLHPGASEPSVFAQWLKRSPVRPSRFLPTLEQEVRGNLETVQKSIAIACRIVEDVKKRKGNTAIN